VGARFAWLLALVLAVSGAALPAGSAVATETDPEVRNLGDGRYRIGTIVADRHRGQLSVPGTVIALDSPESPLEYLAISRGGGKAYESLIELDATAIEFNVACLLIGLEREDSVAETLTHRFDRRPIEGAQVALSVRWRQEDAVVERNAIDLVHVRDGSKPADAWVYTGSMFGPQNQYGAEVFGVVVGLMHDVATIIEHRDGIGIGDYGAAVYDPERTPPAGTPVTLIVRALPR